MMLQCWAWQAQETGRSCRVVASITATNTELVTQVPDLPTGARIFVDANVLIYSLLGIQVLSIAPGLIDSAAAVSQQTGLLSNDALIVAVMNNSGLTHLASCDTDFDRLPGIARYAPV